MILSILLCLFLLILSLYCSGYNIFSPAVITSGIWLFVLVMYFYLGGNLTKLNENSLLPINIWVFVFCFTSLLVQSIKFDSSNLIEPSLLTRKVFYYTSLLTFPLLLFKAYEIVNTSHSLNIFYSLRLAAIGQSKNVDIEDTNPFYVIIWYISYIIELKGFEKKYRHRVIILFIIYLGYAIITMAKVHLLILFCSTIYILYTKRIFSLKIFFIGASFLFLSFFVLQTVRGSSNEKSGTLTNILTNMLDMYLLSPLPALQTILPESSTNVGENTFRFYYAVAYKLGFSDIKPVDTFLPFIDVGTPTNTYTILYPTYKDFGIKGVIFYAIFMGIIFGYVFTKSKYNSSLFIALFAFLLSELIMQYAAEMFLTNLSLNLKRILIVLLPFIISKYRIFERI